MQTQPLERPRQRTPRQGTSQRKRAAVVDRASDYARQVVKKKIVAGPHVRDACARHLKDLKEGSGRGLVWDKAAAELAIDFYADILRLNGGQFEGKPFVLKPWQAFIIGSLYGWKTDAGVRRFRMAYVETAKGSGKSPLAAGIGIKGLVADGEQRAEIYSAATKKDQAAILFRDAVAMYHYSPELKTRCAVSGAAGKEWNIAYNKTMSFFRPIASDEGQSGPRPHVGLIDELHEHRDSTVIEMMRAGVKSRRQPIIFMITNAGSGRTSICWTYHEYACKVASGALQDDSFFAYVCALDENEDPFADESCWVKVNPSLPELPGMQYLREQVTQARGMPAKEALVKRLNFCVWTEAENPWLSPHLWRAAQRSSALDEFKGRRVYAGLDLSSTQDLTSLALLFEPRNDQEKWALKTYFWLPGDGLVEKEDKDHVPYLAWRDAGWLTALPGRAINKREVVEALVRLTAPFQLVGVAYDRWRIEDLKMMLAEVGQDLPMIEFGQGFKDMAPAIDEFERKLLNGQLEHDGNPVMTWNASNAVVTADPAGNRKLDKSRATGRIDGAVASVMAVGITLTAKPPLDLDAFINEPIST
jgi:phage terminase large subunit-like protein